jgi:hypothetical protein
MTKDGRYLASGRQNDEQERRLLTVDYTELSNTVEHKTASTAHWAIFSLKEISLQETSLQEAKHSELAKKS